MTVDYTVIVIGGGINGAGIARELALHKVDCALFEKGDFASGTSSASSKLVHGGFRYLEQLRFGLVQESCKERTLLLKNAPHLVKPLPFLLPVYNDSPHGKWVTRAGMALYDTLSMRDGLPRHSWLSANAVLEKAPGINKVGLKGAALYYDAQMDDSRLCLETLLQAESLGASIRNYHKVTEIALLPSGQRRVSTQNMLTGQSTIYTAKVVINATGCWTDELLNTKAPLLRPSKGVHLVMPATSCPYAFLLRARDKRVFFRIPWHGATLVGTTDTAYQARPDEVSADEKDINYLKRSLLKHFPDGLGEPLSAFSGLRPLINQEGKNTYSLSREEQILVHDKGLVSILGGKYTTYRAIAEKAMKVIAPLVGVSFASQTKNLELPGAGLCHLHLPFSMAINTRLKNTYGSRLSILLPFLKKEERYLRPLGSLDMLEGEVPFCMRYEHVKTPEDFLRRRSDIRLIHPSDVDNLQIRQYFLDSKDAASYTATN